MTGNSKVHHGVPPESLIRLKPQKLGRHYHKIPHIIRELSSKHPRVISDYFLRNYRINLELTATHVHETLPQPVQRTYNCGMGKVGFSIERSFLNEALECYYGGQVMATPENLPITSSEQRLQTRIGADVAQIFAKTLLSGETFGELEEHDDSYDQADWEYVAEYQYLSHITGKRGSLYIYLDTHLVDALTSRLARPAPEAREGNPRQLIEQLPVRLDCVVADFQMPLNEVLALKPNDVVMIRLKEPCEVRINQQKLFRGNVFEQDGALYLTALESVVSP